MKLRNGVASAVTAGAVTAVANRALARRAREFDAALDGDHRSYRWRGMDVAYTEAGDPADPDLVLVHGVNAAGSSHEYQYVFEALAEDYHVIAPDLPGFGHSERPPITYSGSLYESFVADFLADVAENPTVVGSSLSGAYVASAATEADVSGLVLVCPTTDSIPGRHPLVRTLFRSPLVGEALFNLLVSKRSLRKNQADHGYYDMANYDEETMAYEWTTAHQPGARFAPASFVGGFLDPEVDLGDVLADLDVPVTLVWGADAETTPLSRGRELAEAADVRLVSIDRSKLLPHVEHPAEFLDVVRGERAAPGASPASE